MKNLYKINISTLITLIVSMLWCPLLAARKDMDKSEQVFKERVDNLNYQYQYLLKTGSVTIEEQMNKAMQKRFMQGKQALLEEDFQEAIDNLSMVIINKQVRKKRFIWLAIFFMAQAMEAVNNHFMAFWMYNEFIQNYDFYKKNISRDEDKWLWQAIFYLIEEKRNISSANLNIYFNTAADILERDHFEVSSKELVDLNYRIGRHFLMTKDVQSAQDAFSVCLQLAQENVKCRYYLSLAKVMEGEIAVAIKILTQIAARLENADKFNPILNQVYFSLARLTFEKKQYKPAVKFYKKIDATFEKFSRVLYETTWAYYWIGDLSKALQTLDLYLQGTPTQLIEADAWLLKGHILRKQEKYNQTQVYFIRLLKHQKLLAGKLREILSTSSSEAPITYQKLVQQSQIISKKSLGPTIVNWVKEASFLQTMISLENDLKIAAEDIEKAILSMETLKKVSRSSPVLLDPSRGEMLAKGKSIYSELLGMEKKLAGLSFFYDYSALKGKVGRYIKLQEEQNQRINQKMLANLSTSQKMFKQLSARISNYRTQNESLYKHQYQRWIKGIIEIIADFEIKCEMGIMVTLWEQKEKVTKTLARRMQSLNLELAKLEDEMHDQVIDRDWKIDLSLELRSEWVPKGKRLEMLQDSIDKTIKGREKPKFKKPQAKPNMKVMDMKIDIQDVSPKRKQ